MTRVLLAVLGLGLAGLDPTGALLAAAALARGARQTAVVCFAVVVSVGTAAWGTVLSVLSVTAGARLAHVDWSFLVPRGTPGALVELAAAAGLLAWAVVRLRRPAAGPRRTARRRGTGPGALAGVGGLFALSAALDPTFVAVVVLAGRELTGPAVLGAHLAWALLSQAPLVVLAVTVALDRHAPLMAAAGRWWARLSPAAGRALTVVLLLAAAVLALDAGWQLATGRFLIAADA